MTQRQGGFLATLTKWDGKSGFGIDSLRKVLEKLGNPQDRVPSIHVGGTNGKGSTATMIAACLGAAGYRVGLTISPHLMRMTERFIIDGREVNEEWVDRYSHILEAACNEVNVSLTFHEALTAIAFIGFADSGLDYMVVEVGLGGRLDATNVISSPLATVITSIGLDHQEVLGNTEELIAGEKVGIAKQGATMFVGAVSDSVFEVIKQGCAVKGAPVQRFGYDFEDSAVPSQIALLGRHQRVNAAVAAAVVSKLAISKDLQERGLRNCFWPGRLEKYLYNGHEILIDCAHNAHGTRSLREYLDQNTTGKISLIYGTLDTKDWHNSLNLLAPLISDMLYLEPDSDRALSGNTIVDYLSSVPTFKGRVEDGGRSYDKICNYINMLDPKSLILLTGSIYLIGKLRSLLDIPDRPLWSINSAER
jgi:dihydrofolate synthase/folylpolyglutamate synthase